VRYLDTAALDAIDTRAFREAEPFPWANPRGVLTDAAHELLREHLPDVALFEQSFGVARAHHQQAHDRYVLEYRDDLPVAPCWHELVAELRGPVYHAFLCRLLGVRDLWLSFHWHYTPRGCSVSPHCDAMRKLGSQIFYFNTEKDWEPAWGGETLILDDGGRFSRRSAPAFEDFDREIAAEALGNRSVLFARTPGSWHGVRELRCPEGRLRKVFIVVINRMRLRDRLRKLTGRPLEGGY
jgi:hypothetical protein